MLDIQSCRRAGKPGFKAGEDGFCHIYDSGDQAGHRRAHTAARNDLQVKAEEAEKALKAATQQIK